MDCGRFRQGKTVCRGVSRTRRLDPPGTRAEQGADEETGIAAAVGSGDRGLQGRRAGLAIADRCGLAADQEDQVTVAFGPTNAALDEMKIQRRRPPEALNQQE